MSLTKIKLSNMHPTALESLAGGGGGLDSAGVLNIFARSTLYLDSANDRIGIGRITPSTKLDIDGTVTATAFAGSLTGNVTGNADTVTNGVYTAGDQTIGGTKTFSSTISGSINGNAATATTASNTTSISSAVSSGYTWTGAQYFQSNQNTASGVNTAPLQAYSSSGGAIMAFHRSGVYAINMGLDNDNVFRIGGWSASANLFQMDMSGNLTMAGNVTSISDERQKTNIRNIPNALSLVQDMRGVFFDKDGKASVGVIAQEMENVLPEVVHTGEEYKSVAYGNVVGVLIEAIKQLKAEIDELKSSKQD